MPSTEVPPALLKVQAVDSSRTLINSASTSSDHSDTTDVCIKDLNQPRRNWVPDPNEPGRPRTIVICFDGTGDQYDDDNSNIVQLVSCLKKDNQNQQLVYYQPGIGTYTSSVFYSPITQQASKFLDLMIAWNLSKHVQGGYEYLMQNYSEGDKIAIFGFSRGAYTARALAGMIQKVGLLPPFNHAQIPFAWDMYVRDDADGLANSVGFKKTFSTDVTIDFIGVWDTVASVGLFDKELPFVGTNSAIRIFRHALSLDEHRVKFMPNFYHYADGNVLTEQAPQHKRPMSEDDASLLWQAKINEQTGVKTDALEVWFAGCHCDIGGGSVQNGTRHTLARIPLRWMIRQCFLTNTGIIFDKDMLKSVMGIDADTLYPKVRDRPARLPATQDSSLAERVRQPLPVFVFLKAINGLLMLPFTMLFNFAMKPFNHLWLLIKYTRAGKWVRGLFGRKGQETKAVQTTAVVEQQDAPFESEEVEERNDALCPEYDQLSLAWFWWILESIPFRFREQKGDRDDFFVRANFGRGRKIYGDAMRGGLKIHRSVKTRLEVLGSDGKSVYRPRAWFDHQGVDGRVEEGPKVWDVAAPNETTQWEWVD